MPEVRDGREGGRRVGDATKVWCEGTCAEEQAAS